MINCWIYYVNLGDYLSLRMSHLVVQIFTLYIHLGTAKGCIPKHERDRMGHLIIIYQKRCTDIGYFRPKRCFLRL